jgi:DEAD/DEAH box helicase domain-containing protein
MSPDTSRPSIFVYDAIEGGVGYAQRAYEMALEWSSSSFRSLRECKCAEENGCPSCIQSPKCGNNNTPLHRKGSELVMNYISQQLLENEGEAIKITPSNGIVECKDDQSDMPVEPTTTKGEIGVGNGDKIDALLKKGIVIFDLETKHLAHEVGGWSNIKDMGVSVAVTYNTASKEYSIHSGDGVKTMINLLYEAPMVVGFNLHNFDWEVLEGFEGFDRTRIKALDLFSVIKKTTRRKIALNNLGKCNLGMEKTGDGFKAVKWHRSGEFEKLSNYCKRDVEITYNLFLHLLRYEKIKFEVPEFEHVIEVDVDIWDEIRHIL